MRFSFDEKTWTPEMLLQYWQTIHGEIEKKWQQKFLSSPYVKTICQHHPKRIREAIKKNNKLKLVLRDILEAEIDDEVAREEMLNENHPGHSFGITNAHLGNRTTDPFDTGREDLLFKCQRCNLKLSLSLKSVNNSELNICIDCCDKNN